MSVHLAPRRTARHTHTAHVDIVEVASQNGGAASSRYLRRAAAFAPRRRMAAAEAGSGAEWKHFESHAGEVFKVSGPCALCEARFGHAYSPMRTGAIVAALWLTSPESSVRGQWS